MILPMADPDLSPGLVAYLGEESRIELTPRLEAMRDAVLERHGDAVAAILFYGSALRDPEDAALMLDLYVIADGYGRFHGSGAAALANILLPPNVYFIETPNPAGGEALRSKYAVLSLSAFKRRVSPASGESMFWGRFAQPTAILHVRDEAIRPVLVEGLARACQTFLDNVRPLMANTFTAPELWVKALSLSYGTELRAERPERAQEIHGRAPDRYEKIARWVLGELADNGDGTFRNIATYAERSRARAKWRGRKIAGKLLAIFRILKAGVTFGPGGLAYVLGKIENHSGVTVEPTPWQWRHPLLAAPGLAWRLYRRGAFK